MGGKKVDSYLRINYQTTDGTNDLLLTGNNSQRILKAIQSRLKKHPQQSLSNNNLAQIPERKPVIKAFLFWYFALYRYSYKLIKKLITKRRSSD